MRIVAALTLFALTLACGQDPPAPGGLAPEVRDSAGVRIVENPAPPEGSRLPWRVGPEPAVSIGVFDGEEPYMFDWATSVTRLSDGRIVVADMGTAELRVFDEAGIHSATWGGQGEGPGEFASLVHVGRWPGDSIAAWFRTDLGIAILDSEGNYGRSFVLGSIEEVAWRRPRPLDVRETGHILAIRAPEDADTAVVELWDGEGTLSASLGTHPGAEVIVTTDDRGMKHLSWKAYGRELVTGLWGEQVVASPNDRYELRAFGPDGTLARVVRRGHVPRTPTEADRAPYVEGQMSAYQGPGIPAALVEQARRGFETTPFADYFPAFSSVLGDAVGHLWVEEYEIPSEARPGTLWTVFDPNGHALGFVETPEGLEIHEIGEGYILGRFVDELGVEHVQLWPLERG